MKICEVCGAEMIATTEPLSLTMDESVADSSVKEVELCDLEHYACPECGNLLFDWDVLMDWIVAADGVFENPDEYPDLMDKLGVYAESSDEI